MNYQLENTSALHINHARQREEMRILNNMKKSIYSCWPLASKKTKAYQEEQLAATNCLLNENQKQVRLNGTTAKNIKKTDRTQGNDCLT
jgi:hypothetical protein